MHRRNQPHRKQRRRENALRRLHYWTEMYKRMLIKMPDRKEFIESAIRRNQREIEVVTSHLR